MRFFMAVAALGALLLSAPAASAAEGDNKGVKQKFSLTLDGAKKAAAAAEAEAVKNGWNVVIAIVDDGGNLLYLQRLDGTQASSAETATRFLRHVRKLPLGSKLRAAASRAESLPKRVSNRPDCRNI